MKSAELRLLPAAELKSQLEAAEREYATAREAIIAGKEKNHARLSILRRQIARLQTICRAKNIMIS